MKFVPNFSFKKYWQYYTVLAMVVIYALTLIYFAYPIDEVSINKSGVFGDSFGVLTALFSGLAFAGVIISIKMQSKQLRLQRKELKLTRQEISLQREELTLTRKEVRGQKKELKYQNRTMKKQAFEHTFFQMLAVHNNNVKDADYGGKHRITGRAVFKEFSNSLVGIYDHGGVKFSSLEQLTDVYIKFYNNNKYQVSYYFGNLFQLLNFVFLSSVKGKTFYTDIIRVQLSEYELKFICYHGISQFSENNFKSYIEKYCLLKNYSFKDDDFIKSSYDQSVYVENI